MARVGANGVVMDIVESCPSMLQPNAVAIAGDVVEMDIVLAAASLNTDACIFYVEYFVIGHNVVVSVLQQDTAGEGRNPEES